MCVCVYVCVCIVLWCIQSDPFQWSCHRKFSNFVINTLVSPVSLLAVLLHILRLTNVVYTCDFMETLLQRFCRMHSCMYFIDKMS